MSTQIVLSTPDEVLSYWFAATVDGNVASIEERMKLWFFGGSTSFDEIQRNNSELITNLENDTVDKEIWQCEDDPEAALAKVIVLDQFSRSVYRGTAKAFKNDEVCALLINKIIEKGWFITEYSPIERFFLCVALQHSEKLENQTLGVEIASQVGFGASEDIVSFFKNLKGFPLEHYDVIQRFGRFPHRNILLDRESTADEIAWLASDQCPAWAKSQVPKKSP